VVELCVLLRDGGFNAWHSVRNLINFVVSEDSTLCCVGRQYTLLCRKAVHFVVSEGSTLSNIKKFVIKTPFSSACGMLLRMAANIIEKYGA